MTPNQYREAIAALGLDQEMAAEWLRKGLRTVNRYCNHQQVPWDTAMLLSLAIDRKLSPEAITKIAEKMWSEK